MDTVKIDERDIPVVKTVVDLCECYNLEFFREFHSLRRIMTYLQESFDPQGEYQRRTKRKEIQESSFGNLIGRISGETDLYVWSIDLYRFEEVDPTIFTEHYPVLVDYQEARYVLDVQY